MRLSIAALVMSILAAACGGGSAPDPSTVPGGTGQGPDGSFAVGEVVKADLPRSTASVSSGDLAAVVAGDRALGLELLREAAGDGNIMLSPYSVATALSMAYAGARGQTAAEMADVMHLTVEDQTLHGVRSAIDSALEELPPPQDDEDTRQPFTIRPANSAWGQGGYPFQDDYLRVLAEGYGAGLRLVDYMHDPDGATDVINQWTADATEGRIPDLIPAGAIDDLTRLVLVNAIWFEANWAEPFDPAATADGSFTLLNGSEAVVPFMHMSIRTGYADTDLFEAVKLPYAGDALMVIALPKTGSPADLAGALRPQDLDVEWEDAMVDLALPKFEFDSTVPLKNLLTGMGMRAAFTPPVTGAPDEADFTGITQARELYVSDALHDTSITVDENGTEAAAASAVIMNIVSRPMAATFSADRPFLFWIEHSPTAEPLFLGQVTNPAP
ncbi:MAG: serpin family protein [Acidimicrobiia bacterium]